MKRVLRKSPIFCERLERLQRFRGVKNFKCLRQISPKNHYSFGLSMEFDSEADYQAYNDNPLHCAFVENRWKREVGDFLEIDYAACETAWRLRK